MTAPEPIADPALPPVERLHLLVAVGMGMSPMHPHFYRDLRAEFDAVAAEVDAAVHDVATCRACTVIAPVSAPATADLEPCDVLLPCDVCGAGPNEPCRDDCAERLDCRDVGR